MGSYKIRKVIPILSVEKQLHCWIFGKVIDDLLLDFVHIKIDIYKKLSAPEINYVISSSTVLKRGDIMLSTSSYSFLKEGYIYHVTQ